MGLRPVHQDEHDEVRQHDDGPEVRLTRRDALRAALAVGGLGATAGLLGCSPAEQPATPPTVATLLAGRPFWVAHRGGGGDWPEMTAYAYDQAVGLAGLQALEVSVCLSADGVLVCSHDPSTKRVTGVDLTIADQPWSVLSQLQVRASATVDPGQPSRPLSRLSDVTGHAATHVLFAEPKVAAATAPLLDALTAVGQPARTVWKSYVTSTAFAQAKARGFATWGYVLDEPTHTGANLDRLAADPAIDLLGVAVSESDELVAAVVAAAQRNGKQTMAYPLTTAAEVARATSFGCTGLMTSRIRELLPRT